MSDYVTYTKPNAKLLRDLINKAKGNRSVAMFADDIKRSSPSIKVSAPTISRACNLKEDKPVDFKLLEAIEKAAYKDSGVTIEKLAAANGMRLKNNLSEKDTVEGQRKTAMKKDMSVSTIIENEIKCRGYSVRNLSEIYNGYFLRGYMEQQDRVFPRNYNFGFFVSGMYPCSTWKFGLNPRRLSEDSNQNNIEAYVGDYIKRVASVFASDSFESEKYETEKYSFIFVDRKIYDAFLKRISDHGIMVNGLMTAILIDIENYIVLEEMQLKRYDGAEASSFFKEQIIQQEQMVFFDMLGFEDEGEL